jgi:hypothetical protein
MSNLFVVDGHDINVVEKKSFFVLLLLYNRSLYFFRHFSLVLVKAFILKYICFFISSILVPESEVFSFLIFDISCKYFHVLLLLLLLLLLLYLKIKRRKREDILYSFFLFLYIYLHIHQTQRYIITYYIGLKNGKFFFSFYVVGKENKYWICFFILWNVAFLAAEEFISLVSNTKKKERRPHTILFVFLKWEDKCAIT